LVAGGHFTDPNTTDNTYFSVVSLHSIRIDIIASELNVLDIMVGDVSPAYLDAYTQEKVCFKAGPEFGPLEGHLLVIVRALYGLRTSGAQWHDRYANVMRIMDFYPCKADPYVWMKDCDTHYEYVLVYVNDLMFIGKKPQEFFDYLTTEHGFKLKGVESLPVT
jgi:Reverse transcriptase (RNA-dependent DNA polymerase)